MRFSTNTLKTSTLVATAGLMMASGSADAGLIAAWDFEGDLVEQESSTAVRRLVVPLPMVPRLPMSAPALLIWSTPPSP